MKEIEERVGMIRTKGGGRERVEGAYRTHVLARVCQRGSDVSFNLKDVELSNVLSATSRLLSPWGVPVECDQRGREWERTRAREMVASGEPRAINCHSWQTGHARKKVRLVSSSRCLLVLLSRLSLSDVDFEPGAKRNKKEKLVRVPVGAFQQLNCSYKLSSPKNSFEQLIFSTEFYWTPNVFFFFIHFQFFSFFYARERE